jgi:hypothetical protein
VEGEARHLSLIAANEIPSENTFDSSSGGHCRDLCTRPPALSTAVRVSAAVKVRESMTLGMVKVSSYPLPRNTGIKAFPALMQT